MKDDVDSREYSYPDAEDRITALVIAERAYSEGSWERSEQRVLKLIEEYVRKSPGSLLLDAGCGTGRLLPRFQVYFDKILAVDRDADQIRKAKDLVSNLGFENKVVFEATSVQSISWPRESVDATLCSHLLQHIRTDLVSKVIRRLWTLSKVNGLLFLMTTHAGNEDYFTKEYSKGQQLVEEQISQNEFNTLVENRRNILPIHFFSKKNLEKIVRDSGFKQTDHRLYHKVTCRETNRGRFRDVLLIGKKGNC